jgi:hypothetical protein
VGLLGMIRESMFGNQSDLWRPVPLNTFFSEGWLKPWYNYSRSTTGVIRGGTGVTIPTNDAGVTSTVAGIPTVPGSRTTLNYDLAVSKYWTPHDATPGDLVTYLSTYGYTTLDDRGPRYSYHSLTPAFRFHLTNDYYISAGIEVCLTGPKDQSFTYSPIFWLTKVW